MTTRRQRQNAGAMHVVYSRQYCVRIDSTRASRPVFRVHRLVTPAMLCVEPQLRQPLNRRPLCSRTAVPLALGHYSKEVFDAIRCTLFISLFAVSGLVHLCYGISLV